MYVMATAFLRLSAWTTTVRPAKTAEPIEMPFGMWARVGQRNHALHGGTDSHTWRGNFEGEKGQAEYISEHVRQSIYSKGLSRVQNRCGLRMSIGVYCT